MAGVPQVPLIDERTGSLSYEWVHQYSRGNDCSISEAFSVGMKELIELEQRILQFKKYFLANPYEVVHNYKAFSAGSTVMDVRGVSIPYTLKSRERPNINARQIPVIVQLDP